MICSVLVGTNSALLGIDDLLLLPRYINCSSCRAATPSYRDDLKRDFLTGSLLNNK
jgi:hypothetical protein